MRFFVYGTLTLLIAAMMLITAFSASVLDVVAGGEASGTAYVLIGIGVLFAILTIAAWTHALRSTEGDDYLSGQRGLLLSGMIIATLAVGVVVALAVIDPGWWQGFSDASR
ncbi:MAG TPA: hypothetical protein VLU46_12025 [Thermoanaerobaculia bacterium]|nr:hypothetical protein [Thermoanaerobaculia bacterium]